MMIRLIAAIFRHPQKPPRPHILEVRDENTARIKAERNTTRRGELYAEQKRLTTACLRRGA